MTKRQNTCIHKKTCHSIPTKPSPKDKAVVGGPDKTVPCAYFKAILHGHAPARATPRGGHAAQQGQKTYVDQAKNTLWGIHGYAFCITCTSLVHQLLRQPLSQKLHVKQLLLLGEVDLLLFCRHLERRGAEHDWFARLLLHRSLCTRKGHLPSTHTHASTRQQHIHTKEKKAMQHWSRQQKQGEAKSTRHTNST